MKNLIISTLALSLFAFGCGDTTESDYDPTWGDSQSLPNTGKGDFLNLATPIKFDERVTGSVNETQLEVYKLQLISGDKITLNGKATSGSLVPDVSLFTQSGRSIKSDSFDVGNQEITKEYLIESGGEHLIVVRAFRNQGSGKYAMMPTCDGGPCNGEISTIPVLDEFEIVDCVQKATECAFDVLPSFNGRVAEKTATKILKECLAKTPSDFGETCATACEFNDEATELCDIIISALPFYADQNDSCLDTLNSCVDECTSINTSFSSDIEDSEFGICWASGLNSDCDIFARRMPECGGHITNDVAFCYEECEAITGSHVDDLSDICDESCGVCGIECMTQRWGENFNHPTDLVGDLEDSFIGEVDPFIFGDTCVFFIEVIPASANDNFKTGVYGIVDDNCSGDVSHGTALSAEFSALTKVTKRDELDELQKLRDVDFYVLNGDFDEVF